MCIDPTCSYCLCLREKDNGKRPWVSGEKKDTYREKEWRVKADILDKEIQTGEQLHPLSTVYAQDSQEAEVEGGFEWCGRSLLDNKLIKHVRFRGGAVHVVGYFFSFVLFRSGALILW